ncbi:hypothetical protein AB0M39_20010 [Streptomyces sp. NPDC051907]|uniref:hypothetical protein n=1 Tax=Streptomyces sp. NPDC051907 TaxID=3155284 RepID=UPI0034183D53
MTATTAEQAGRRVEEILDQLAAAGDEQARAAAEELVRVLMDFYGAGLARTVELLRAAARPGQGQGAAGDGDPLAALLGDRLVASLLVLHDLHPEDLDTRVARALDSVRGLGVEAAGFDDATGALRLRTAKTSGCGCPSTQEATRQAAADAVAGFAPEVSEVLLEAAGAAPEPALLQIGRSPHACEAAPSSVAAR